MVSECTAKWEIEHLKSEYNRTHVHRPANCPHCSTFQMPHACVLLSPEKSQRYPTWLPTTHLCKILWDTPPAVVNNSPSNSAMEKVLSTPSIILLNLNPINSKWPGSYKIRCDLIRFRSQLRVQSLMPSWSLACITPQNLSIKDDWIYYNTLKFASMKIELKLFNFAFLCS